MEIPWDKSFIWTVATPFDTKGFVKGIIGVLNRFGHKINTTIIAFIVLSENTGTRVLKKDAEAPHLT